MQVCWNHSQPGGELLDDDGNDIWGQTHCIQELTELKGKMGCMASLSPLTHQKYAR